MYIENLSQVENVPPGKYAMWFPTPDEACFTESETRKHILRVYQALNGYESYVFASLLKDFKVLDEGDNRVDLPDSLFTVYLKEAEDNFLIFSASQEKGMRFHFPVENTSTFYLISFWQGYADYVETRRKMFEENGSPKDSAENANALGWWLACEQVILDEEKAGRLVGIVGTVFI